MTGEPEKNVEECLQEALARAENQEAKYWIRTALQKLVVDEDLEDR